MKIPQMVIILSSLFLTCRRHTVKSTPEHISDVPFYYSRKVYMQIFCKTQEAIKHDGQTQNLHRQNTSIIFNSFIHISIHILVPALVNLSDNDIPTDNCRSSLYIYNSNRQINQVFVYIWLLFIIVVTCARKNFGYPSHYFEFTRFETQNNRNTNMVKNNKRQSKTAAKKEKRKESVERKKQHDLRKALGLVARAKKKADRLSDDRPSPTKGRGRTVSPEKDVCSI